MKTIYRQLFFGVLLTALMAFSSLVVVAQTADPCEGAGESYKAFVDLFPKTDVPGRKAAIAAGKSFLEKFGSCEAQKDGAVFVKEQLPAMEKALEDRIKRERKRDLLLKFNNGLTAKNWDDVYASGKELLAEYPDDLRDAKLALGSIGLEETGKTPSVTKWNDETIKYAKESIADIEAGKKFTAWGVKQFTYKGKEDALGWMNYTIGFILMNDKKNKKEGAAYMYKVSQINADAKNTPYAYVAIGLSFIDDLNTNIEQSKALPGLDVADTPEVSQQKADAIKAKAAMIKGYAERIMDAYARAYMVAPVAGKVYKDSLKAKFKEIYDIRFRTPDATTPTVDAWINTAFAKPLPNPASSVAPVVEAEKTTAATPGPATTVKPIPTTVKPANPSTVKPGAPTTKPAGPGAKPTTVGIKPAVAKAKKKGTR